MWIWFLWTFSYKEAVLKEDIKKLCSHFLNSAQPVTRTWRSGNMCLNLLLERSSETSLIEDGFYWKLYQSQAHITTNEVSQFRESSIKLQQTKVNKLLILMSRNGIFPSITRVIFTYHIIINLKKLYKDLFFKIILINYILY